MRQHVISGLLVLITVIGVACGSVAAPTPIPAPAPTPIPAPTPTPTPEIVIDSVDIRAAFETLPESFIEIDPTEANFTIAALRDDELFTIADIAVYASAEPFEFVFVITGTVTNLQRIGFDVELSSPETYLAGVTQVLDEEAEATGLQVIDSGLLDNFQVGDKSIAVFLELETEGVILREELTQFRRANNVGLVTILYLPGISTGITLEQAAALLDSEIQRLLDFASPR